ncbi:hypothetical protein L211DRAFT_804956 [Terfezia boudieri ATCC MYA-4762]|uniref:BTB domain-containing protein n=1 Tax=Terfezia boudieri ATCC MYA-4762 TaxID=1051890 RepID=A0A3N4LTL0_9PEZI|nr:hypothetical protein L211DRAFT_804956 [Terfezia boudieri ATCC MYA-4762]
MASPEPPLIASPLIPDRVASMDFDLEGDVLLTLPSTSGIARFRVNSNILCIASPVFRAMLGAKSQFRERAALSARTSTSEPLELSLADDDPNALTVILRIIHLQYDWVPPSLNADQLYTIAVICDKYDMRQSLEVWLVNWISPLVEPSASPVSGDNWLFIAYALGRKDLFRRLTKELILQCRSDEDGNLLMNGNTLSEHIPGHIVAEISARRQQTIKGMNDCLYSIVQEYSAPDTSKCKCTSKQDACDDIALGFLIRTFKRLKIYPEASQIVLQQAIQEFKTLLDGVSFPSNVLFEDGTSKYQCRYCNNHSSANYCYSCHRTAYVVANGTSHANTCSPLLGYKEKIQDLYNSIEGLSYTDFVRVNALATAPPPGVNLWDCLQYK